MNLYPIKLTLDQVNLVRSILRESLNARAQTIDSKALKDEYLSRGSQGRKEWEDLLSSTATLQDALRAF